MRTKKIFLFILLAAFGLISCEEGSNWTTDKTVDALKQALEIGAEKAVDIVSKPDGYLNSDIHIALPDDAQKAFDVISFLNKSGFGSVLSKVGIDADLESTLTTLINRAAEDAAPQAVNVFTSAITGMTIADGKNILFGADNAATQYLEDNTYTQLQAAFEPSISTSLGTVKVGEYTPNDAWATLAKINNVVADNKLISGALSLAGISFNKVDTNLANYVTGKALDGLFTKVAVQELDIRKNAAARTTTLLQDVFGQLDDK